jgi:hypothetical protein
MHRSGAHCLVVVRKRGNARGAKEAGHPGQDGVNGKPEELLSWRSPAGLPWGGTSRMRREFHVRICEGLGVQFPGPTRLVSRVTPVHTAVRNCTRDEGGPFEFGNQVLISSHRKLLSSKAMVVLCQEDA